MQELAAIFRLAEVFIYPSLFLVFGFLCVCVLQSFAYLASTDYLNFAHGKTDDFKTIVEVMAFYLEEYD